MSNAVQTSTQTAPRRRPRVTWVDMPLVEAFLQENGAKLSTAVVNFSDINFTRSRQVQSRLTFHLDNDFVEEIKSGIKEGIPLFRPVLYKSPRATKYVIWDGQHRLAACKELGIRSCEAYIVDLSGSDDNEVYADLLPRRINNIANGQRPGKVQTRAAILYASQKYNLTAPEISRLFGAPRSSVYNILREAKARRDLSELTGVDVSFLADGTCSLLIRLKSNRKVLQSATRLAATNRLSIAQTRTLVEAVVAAPNEAAKLKVIADAAKTFKVEKNADRKANTGSGLRRRHNVVASSIQRLFTVLAPYEKPTFSLLDIPSDRVKEVREMAKSLSQKLGYLARSSE